MSIEASQRCHLSILLEVGDNSLEINQGHQHNGWAGCDVLYQMVQISVNSHANWLRSGKGSKASINIRCRHFSCLDVLSLSFSSDKNSNVSEDHLRRIESSGSGRDG